MIVIEGPDATGKSTLAGLISARLGMRIVESTGPVLTQEDLANRLTRYREMNPDTIAVRHPCISQTIYGKYRGSAFTVPAADLLSFYGSYPAIIYCDVPPRRLQVNHKLKGYDSMEHILTITKNADGILADYRLWAVKHAHLIYRIGDDTSQLLNAVQGIVDGLPAA